MVKKLVTTVAIVGTLALGGACASEPLEVTREVPVTREVEVTREVPVTREVEVTRVSYKPSVDYNVNTADGGCQLITNLSVDPIELTTRANIDALAVKLSKSSEQLNAWIACIKDLERRMLKGGSTVPEATIGQGSATITPLGGID